MADLKPAFHKVGIFMPNIKLIVDIGTFPVINTGKETTEEDKDSNKKIVRLMDKQDDNSIAYCFSCIHLENNSIW